MLRHAENGEKGGGIGISADYHHEGACSNVICDTRGVVDVQFPEKKKRYVTLEWPHMYWHHIL